jgi:hypothetical protein
VAVVVAEGFELLDLGSRQSLVPDQFQKETYQVGLAC